MLGELVTLLLLQSPADNNSNSSLFLERLADLPVTQAFPLTTASILSESLGTPCSFCIQHKCITGVTSHTWPILAGG